MFGIKVSRCSRLCSRVSCVRFSPNLMNPVIVSCGWDKVVKVCSCRNPLFLAPWERGDVTFNICYFRGIHLPMRLKYITKISDPLASVRHIPVMLFTDNSVSTGLGTVKIQAENKPPRPHWLHQHHFCFPRWFLGCLRRKGWHHNALGP